jgi:formate/nitrite transporter FocA (FNT family)
MDYAKPTDVVASMIDAGSEKLALGPRDLLIRGAISGALLGVYDWRVWDQIPVTLGNLIGGFVFTGLALYVTHKPAKQTISAAPVVAQAAAE